MNKRLIAPPFRLVEEHPDRAVSLVGLLSQQLTDVLPAGSSHKQRIAHPHRLVEEHPDRAVSWFAVGCYYMACQQYEAARRYFGKASPAACVVFVTWFCLVVCCFWRRRGATWARRAHGCVVLCFCVCALWGAGSWQRVSRLVELLLVLTSTVGCAGK